HLESTRVVRFGGRFLLKPRLPFVAAGSVHTIADAARGGRAHASLRSSERASRGESVVEGVLDLRLAVPDLAAPTAFLDTAAFDVALESFHRSLDVRAHRAERVTDVLEHALRLVLHHQPYSRARSRQRLEVHGARVRRIAVDAAPRDELIRDLLGDLGVPLLFLAPQL